MASKGMIIQDTFGSVVVKVDHLDTDSFSRSVDRAASLALQQAVNRRTVTHMKGDYAYTSTGRKCVSLIAYARSFNAAEELLLQNALKIGGFNA